MYFLRLLQQIIADRVTEHKNLCWHSLGGQKSDIKVLHLLQRLLNLLSPLLASGGGLHGLPSLACGHTIPISTTIFPSSSPLCSLQSASALDIKILATGSRSAQLIQDDLIIPRSQLQLQIPFFQINWRSQVLEIRMRPCILGGHHSTILHQKDTWEHMGQYRMKYWSCTLF